MTCSIAADTQAVRKVGEILDELGHDISSVTGAGVAFRLAARFQALELSQFLDHEI